MSFDAVHDAKLVVVSCSPHEHHNSSANMFPLIDYVWGKA